MALLGHSLRRVLAELLQVGSQQRQALRKCRSEQPQVFIRVHLGLVFVAMEHHTGPVAATAVSAASQLADQLYSKL